MKHKHTALIATLGSLLTALIILSLPSGSVAQAGGSKGPIAVCDLVEVFNNYERSADLVEELNNKKADIAAEMTRMDAEIDALGNLLAQGIKEGAAYEKQYELYRSKVITAQIWAEMAERQLNIRHLDQRREIYQETLDTIADIAKQEGYSLVLFRDSRDTAAESIQEFAAKLQARKMLYNDDRLEITAAVLNKLNLAYQRR